MNVVVTYRDTNNLTRWGYLTHDVAKLLHEYTELKNGGKENETSKDRLMLLGNTSIIVFLPDGTTGNAKIEHLETVYPFSQYLIDKSGRVNYVM